MCALAVQVLAHCWPASGRSVLAHMGGVFPIIMGGLFPIMERRVPRCEMRICILS